MAATLLVQVQDSGTMTAKFFAASAYDTLVESVALTRGSTNLGWATGTISTASGLCLCRVVDGSDVTKGWWSGVIPSSGTVIIGDMSGVDWQQVANATTTVGLSGTTVKAVTDRVTANADQIAGSTLAATITAAINGSLKTGTVDDATFAPTSTTFETDITTDSDEFTKQTILWTGGLNAGMFVRVLSYAFANSKVKLTLSEALPNVPADGDTFAVTSRIE